METKLSWRQVLNLTVVISSLGYFVDIYDLILFSIVRVSSLKAIGIPDSELMTKGAALLDFQMGGMLLGGLIWGILGDKRGRVSVLYGSILLYSLANLANAFVTNFEAYAALRFLAGLGLAGELGAAVTLVTEQMPVSARGYGVAIVAAFGIIGAIFAAVIAETFSWQVAYIVGGLMGLSLLVLRMKMHDSHLFAAVHADQGIKKGQFLMFFTEKKRFLRYLSCIFMGAPNWFIIGILVAFAPEITAQLHISEPLLVSKAIAWLYLGLSTGDLASGFLSQWLKSRKKVLGLFLSLTIPIIAIYLTKTEATPTFYYGLFYCLGIGNGYWAVLITTSAEQFGTNLRATAATTVPNFVRAMVIPLSLSVHALEKSFGLINAVSIVAVVCLALAFLALSFLQETYSRDLDFVEGLSDSQNSVPASTKTYPETSL